MAVSVEWTPATVPELAGDLQRVGYPERLAALLARRGVTDAASGAAFLEPSLDHLHTPTLLRGLPEAVARLGEAREKGEGVALVGDYDVDGVTATALLSAVFRACGLRVSTILPHRLRDGYGFQPAQVEQAREEGCSVIVTVDCGTTSSAAAEAAHGSGIDVIVTDHHLPGAALPEHVLLVNPRQPECSYPFDELCGAGLAFKLGTAFAESCGRDLDPRALLRVACLGTIADMVPLRGENRVIAALGLEELGRSRSPGLKALIHSARVKPPLSAADVGFRLGPRINAAGRLDSADKALELLLSRDSGRAAELAAELEGWNRARQERERGVTEEARTQVQALDELPPMLMCWSDGWHQGVVGIAAGRLAREFNRPVLLLTVDGETATGSGRSIEGIHLHDFLSAWRSEMVRFGGHAQAVGLTLEVSRLESLRDDWQQAAAAWSEQVARRSYEYELELGTREVGEALFEELQRLEPHGQGNIRPLLKIRGPLRLHGAPRFFGRGHLSASVEGPDGGRIRILGWGWQERLSSLEGDFEVLGYLERDNYRGSTVIRLLDSRPWQGEGHAA